MSTEMFFVCAGLCLTVLVISGVLIDRLREIGHGVTLLVNTNHELRTQLNRALARDYESSIDHIYTTLTVAHDEEGKMLVDALRTRKPIKKRRKKNVG